MTRNADIWSGAEAIRVAQEQEPLRLLFMYNLNKLRKRAVYDRPIDEDQFLGSDRRSIGVLVAP
ncbi:MAG: hypothetical protein V3V67_03870 [Myxococcota bacterium]